MNRLLAFVALSATVVTLSQTTSIHSADACSFAQDPLHQIDQGSADTTAPSLLSVADITITRGVADCGSGTTNSCGDIGTVQIALDPPTDNETPVDQFGYVLRIVSGQAPEGLFSLTTEAVRFPSGIIYLRWVDGFSKQQEPIQFDLGMTPVDVAGNLGPETVVAISDPGSTNACEGQGLGCNATSPVNGLAPWALLAVAVLLAFLWRRRRSTY